MPLLNDIAAVRTRLIRIRVRNPPPAVSRAGLTLLMLIILTATIDRADRLVSAPQPATITPQVLPFQSHRFPATSPVQVPADDVLSRHIQDVLQVVHRYIDPETGLSYSFTGDSRLRHWAVVYDNAIRVLVHLNTGRVDLARRTLDYFMSNSAIRKSGWVRKDGRLIRQDGWIVNIVDAAEGRPGGRGIEHIAHTGPNVYLGIAAIHLYRETGEKKYLAFARERWGLIKDLQNEDPSDPNFGGVRMGPMGNPQNPSEQRLMFKPDQPSFYSFYNGEHAADFMAFSNLMAHVDPARKSAYLHAADLIGRWDEKIYDRVTRLFYIGTTEVRYFDEYIDVWVEPGVIPMHPLDTTALKISAYGVEGLNRFETNGAEKIRKAIDTHFRVTVPVSDEKGARNIVGYDFVSHFDRARIVLYEETGPVGDVKVKKGIGRKPLLSDEWSNWVALADLRLAADYEHMKDAARAGRYLRSYYDNAVDNGLRSARRTSEGLAYPYAHPLPYSLNKPVGFGWNTHHIPFALIGGMARTLGLLRFDPFLINGGEYAARLPIITPEFTGDAEAGVREELPALYTEAEIYLREAWSEVRLAEKRTATESRHWHKAIAAVERMLREHPDWVQVAKRQNVDASRAKIKYPLMGMSDLTLKDLEPVYRRYWALYHVGTAEFIKVMAYANLRDIAAEKGDGVNHLSWTRKVKAQAKIVSENYPYAQAFDESGWFWQPVQSLREYVN